MIHAISKETVIPKWSQEPFKFTYLLLKIHWNTKHLTNLRTAIYDSNKFAQEIITLHPMHMIFLKNRSTCMALQAQSFKH